ncbi:serine protease 7-like [Contarinia nasturtii]|uniref:serine protease 7-like n=1 Tax=Contarinia nasturtii TaxID=265458 RepID=UPI0012D4A917|nr:serine protease 7-like [Contarinia nasturtii]
MIHFDSYSIYLVLFYFVSQQFCVHGALIPNPSSQSPNCGVQLFEDRIVGGNVTSLYDYPWSAIIRYHNARKRFDSWGCSGSYIGGRTVVTAAHCVDSASKRDLGEIVFLRLGEYDTENNPDCIGYGDDKACNETPFDSPVTRIVIHPKRSDSSKEYDIAIIILEIKPPYTDFIRPICLPDLAEKDLIDTNEILYVTGWGWTIGYVRSPSNIKRHVRIEAVQYDICRQQYEKILLNPNSQLCAGGQSGMNPCRGDSGGPLMRLVRGIYWQLIGLVSFGPGVCAIEGVSGKAAVFTKINYFIPFIVENSL